MIHKDSYDNLLCSYAGSKRLAIWHPRFSQIEDVSFGWHNSTGKASDYGYGSFGGPPLLDVDNVDLKRYPGSATHTLIISVCPLKSRGRYAWRHNSMIHTSNLT